MVNIAGQKRDLGFDLRKLFGQQGLREIEVVVVDSGSTDGTVALAREHGFARGLVNSGRLSVPSHLSESALNTPDGDAFAGTMAPGAPLADVVQVPEPGA